MQVHAPNIINRPLIIIMSFLSLKFGAAHLPLFAISKNDKTVNLTVFEIGGHYSFYVWNRRHAWSVLLGPKHAGS